jgi:hypothetical protein
MLLIIEIAAGVFLGGVGLLAFLAFPEWLERRRWEKQMDRNFQAQHVREMEELRRARPDLCREVEEGRMDLWQAQVHLRDGSSVP